MVSDVVFASRPAGTGEAWALSMPTAGVGEPHTVSRGLGTDGGKGWRAICTCFHPKGLHGGAARWPPSHRGPYDIILPSHLLSPCRSQAGGEQTWERRTTTLGHGALREGIETWGIGTTDFLIMGLRFCKEGHLMQVIVEEHEDITLLILQEGEAVEAHPPPPIAPVKKPPADENERAKQIQAWWRGTLVRRTLLLAALSACVVQRWWRRAARALPWLRQKRQRALLTRQTWAAVRLQAWVRMWCVRLRYCRLLQAARIIQAYWRCHSCHGNGFLRGRYKLMANKLGLELEIFLGSQICRITECIPFPIKN